jgi:formylmethanofuran dehydrogenase subunit D
MAAVAVGACSLKRPNTAATRMIEPQVLEQANSGTSASGADLADMLLGAPAGATGFIPTKLYESVTYNSWYVHDDWRVSSKLTLNLGIRWERETGLREANNNLITGFKGTTANPIGTQAGYPVTGVFQYAGVLGQKTTTGNPNLNKFSPTPYMEINPDAAAAMGVEHMGYVRLVSRRGDAIVMAQLTQRVPRDMVFIPFHFHDCVNRLTLGLLDPYSRQPAFKQSAVRIEPIDQRVAAETNVAMRSF